MLDGETIGMPAAYIKGMPAWAADEQLVPIVATTLGSDEILVAAAWPPSALQPSFSPTSSTCMAGDDGAIGLSDLDAALGVGAQEPSAPSTTNSHARRRRSSLARVTQPLGSVQAVHGVTLPITAGDLKSALPMTTAGQFQLVTAAFKQAQPEWLRLLRSGQCLSRPGRHLGRLPGATSPRSAPGLVR